jgi:type I restriction enzyme, S subunit
MITMSENTINSLNLDSLDLYDEHDFKNQSNQINQSSDNTPKLRFPEFSGDWEKKKLGEVASNKSGKFNPENENVSVKCIELEHLASESSQLLGFIDGKNSGSIKNKFDKGDVLFGKLRPYLKKYLQAPFDGVCSSEIWVMKGINVSNDFLFRIVQTNKFIELANQSSGSKMPRADWSVVENGIFSFPTLPEQQRIATFLTAVDSKLQSLKKKKSLLEEYKKGVMQKLFSVETECLPSLRFKPALSEVEGDENGNDFPDWEEKFGGDLFESISNKNHNSDLPILAISQEFGAVPREMINYQISVTDKSIDSYKVVEKGDFIISLRSFQGGIEYSNYKGICSPAYIILRSKAKIDDTFFRYYFKTEFYIQQLCSKLEGIRDGKMISYKYFSEIELPYPSLSEQTRIANFLSSIDEKINHCQKQIENTEVWKKGLLQKMFV